MIGSLTKVGKAQLEWQLNTEKGGLHFETKSEKKMERVC